MSNLLEAVAIWLCLALPSVAVVQKFAGSWGLGVYGGTAALGVWIVLQYEMDIGERKALFLSVATLAGLALVFALAYPIANTQIAGLGSDDDDALNTAVAELLKGHYPYYAPTYLGNLIHQLPGAFLLAAPFALLSTSALQNLAWLAAMFFMVRYELKSTSNALRWLWLMLACSPLFCTRSRLERATWLIVFTY